MEGIVSGAVARGLRDAAERAEAAGLPPETVAAGFLHVCRMFCEGLQRRETPRGN